MKSKGKTKQKEKNKKRRWIEFADTLVLTSTTRENGGHQRRWDKEAAIREG